MRFSTPRFPLLLQTIRRLAGERGFAATVLLTLALCIGANVAIFAVVDALLLRPLPFPEAERLVVAINAYPQAGVPRAAASLANYYDRRGAIDAFESVAIHQGGSAIIGEPGSPTRAPRDRVSPEFFETLGAPLALGRPFSDDDMVYANAQILILTHEFWQSYFDGDPSVLGRAVTVDGLENFVVGVLAPGFRFLDSKARFFIPLASNLDEREIDDRHNNSITMIARLRPGATIAEAQAQMNAFNEVQLETDPLARIVREAGYRTDVFGLQADTVRQARPVLLMLQVGALSLLAIGGVNLVNLLLIRANGRLKELAVRQALGADRRHLAREIALETVLLAVGGGLLGLAVGAVGIRLLRLLGSEQIPLGATIAFDWRVALVSLAASLAFGLCLALPIIGFNLRRDLADSLRAESRGGTVSRAAHEARHAFIVVQIALAFALLSAAGLLGISLKNVLSASPGFRPDHALTASLTLPWKNYPEPPARQAFLERFLEELRALPGATHVGLGSGLPFGSNANNSAVAVEGIERPPGEAIRTHYNSFAMGEYWQALGIPLVAGRFLEDADNRSEQRVCVVDQAVVQRYWPGENALGRRIAVDVSVNDENAMTIVGVVGTVKQQDLADAAPLGAIYMPYRLQPTNSLSIVVRTAAAPEAMAASLRQLALSLDPTLPVDDIKPLQARIDDSLIARRAPATLALVFAAVALALAAVGTYGVLAYAVSQRRREIGVRIALGAQPGQVLRQFLAVGAWLLLGGVALGALGSWAAGKAMRSMVFEIAPLHLGLLLFCAGAMTLVVFAATLLPSRRAARISPLEAMREE